MWEMTDRARVFVLLLFLFFCIPFQSRLILIPRCHYTAHGTLATRHSIQTRWPRSSSAVCLLLRNQVNSVCIRRTSLFVHIRYRFVFSDTCLHHASRISDARRLVIDWNRWQQQQREGSKLKRKVYLIGDWMEIIPLLRWINRFRMFQSFGLIDLIQSYTDQSSPSAPVVTRTHSFKVVVPLNREWGNLLNIKDEMKIKSYRILAFISNCCFRCISKWWILTVSTR